MKNIQGFSLLELAIVLTVLGLLAGAITTGKYIYHRLELKNLMDDVSKLNNAFNEFKGAYQGLPGDLWNADVKLGSTAAQVGNGNDMIDNTTSEPVLALLHLGLAGLIKGNYSGSWTVSNTRSFMVGPLRTVKYYFGSISRASAGARTIFDGSTNETIAVVANIIDANANSTILWPNEATYSSLTPYDMFLIDQKYDDSYPTTGLIIAADGVEVSTGTCVNTGVSPNAYVYSSNTIPTCYFGVILDQKLQ